MTKFLVMCCVLWCGVVEAGLDRLQHSVCQGDYCRNEPLGQAISFGVLYRNDQPYEVLYACCAHQVEQNMQVYLLDQWRSVSAVHVRREADIAILRVRVQSFTRTLNLYRLGRRMPARASELHLTTVRTSWRARVRSINNGSIWYDVPPIPGDSGGAICDSEGYLVGVISGYSGDQGVGGALDELRSLLSENGIRQDQADDFKFVPADQAPVVSAPVENTPTPAIGDCRCEERFQRIERMIASIETRLIEIDNSETPTSEIEALRLELESLKSLVGGIDSLRSEIAAMREAELRVRIRQSGGNVIEDTVTIFDPSDSLNLQLPER